jgi:aryl-alcohol dehydrogenase-like predicted oxidoreductase
MRREGIGATGLPLSVVGLVGYEFGDDPGWAGVRDVVEAAIGAGINSVDTSEAYFDGRNEQSIAAALRDVPAEVLISAKVDPAPEGTGFEPGQVREACEKSLTRLGVERLDMYVLHWPDRDGVALEGTWAAMLGLVAPPSSG